MRPLVRLRCLTPTHVIARTAPVPLTLTELHPLPAASCSAPVCPTTVRPASCPAALRGIDDGWVGAMQAVWHVTGIRGCSTGLCLKGRGGNGGYSRAVVEQSQGM